MNAYIENLTCTFVYLNPIYCSHEIFSSVEIEIIVSLISNRKLFLNDMCKYNYNYK